jgi:glycosyltransferase involved in cell wall biosynthesis
MRIAVLHSRYLSGPVSGENRVVEDQVRLLRSGGHDVVAWTPSADGVPLAQVAAGTVWSSRAASRVRALIGQARPDVVHVHNLYPMLSPAVLRAVGSLPLVMTLHNFRYACLPGTLFRDGVICEDCVGSAPWPGVLHACYRGSHAASATLAASLTLHRGIGSFRRVDAFVALSGFMRQTHVRAGLPEDRIVVQTNFTWPTERREGPGDYLLYIGRLSPEKGLGPLIEAWGRARLRLVVVGEGPEEERLRALAPPTVELRGSVPASEVPALLRGARALVVPSTWYEGAPRAIVEAYAAGVPVLASDLGALPEIVVEGRTGFLLPPDRPEAWVEAADQIAGDGVGERMGEAAYERWREVHGPEHALAALEEVYALAADRRAVRP